MGSFAMRRLCFIVSNALDKSTNTAPQKPLSSKTSDFQLMMIMLCTKTSLIAAEVNKLKFNGLLTL